MFIAMDLINLPEKTFLFNCWLLGHVTSGSSMSKWPLNEPKCRVQVQLYKTEHLSVIIDHTRRLVSSAAKPPTKGFRFTTRSPSHNAPFTDLEIPCPARTKKDARPYHAVPRAKPHYVVNITCTCRLQPDSSTLPKATHTTRLIPVRHSNPGQNLPRYRSDPCISGLHSDIS